MTSEPARRSGSVDRLSPDGLVKNPAFSQVAVVSGPVRTIYVGGQDRGHGRWRDRRQGRPRRPDRPDPGQRGDGPGGRRRRPRARRQVEPPGRRGPGPAHGVRGVSARVGGSSEPAAHHVRLRAGSRPARVPRRDGRHRRRPGLRSACRQACVVTTLDPMTELPTGTATFMFTDIEGSTGSSRSSDPTTERSSAGTRAHPDRLRGRRRRGRHRG